MAGKPEKKEKIKSLVREKCVDVLFLQETNRSSMDDHFVKTIWPYKELEFMLVDSKGSAGGLLCIWRPQVFELKGCCSSKNFIILSGISSNCFQCTLVNIYALNEVLRRRQLWDSLVSICQHFPNPWCMGGDFNEIRYMGERKGCSSRERGMKDFNEFVEKLELTDMPLLGRQYTWCNALDRNMWSRIDRFLLDLKWMEKFSFKQWGLPRTISDHCPILIKEDDRDWGPKPFKFINA
ncbi:uncharacterized protein LOC114265607 [Camellia sinensis]|uniref:uncharacterized protein LOC114265607 n=1 Tax=Camellia sinensis TaxID=4442 RepID=UPI00103600CD|nr:uncharacterized protein LOC114265607 [Camellia sinensis]